MPLLIGRLLVFACASLLVASAGEAYFRQRESEGRGVDRFVSDATLGWAARQSTRLLIKSSESTVEVSYNSLGLLGPEIGRDKTPGKLRVLALGDSFTEAAQVPAETRFTTLLQNGLAAEGQVEVLNAGVAGYQTDQEVLAYETRWRDLRPDVVLLFLFIGNDVMGNATDQRQPGVGPRTKPRFHLIAGELILDPLPVGPDGRPLANAFDPRIAHVGTDTAPVDRLKSAAYASSALYRAAADAVYVMRSRFARAQVPFDWTLFARHSDDRVQEAWDLTTALLMRLSRDVTQDGGRLAVVIIPDAIQVDGQRWNEFLRRYAVDAAEWDPAAPDARLAEICDRGRLRCLDLVPALTPRAAEMYYRNDAHLTPAGHRATATAVLDWMRREGLARQ